MEIWYTLTGDIEKKGVQDAIAYINSELYSKPIDRLRFLTASGHGDVASGINMYEYLRALPVEVETIGFGEVDLAAAILFLGGKKRLAVEGCKFFFHEGRYTVENVTGPLRAHEEQLAGFRDALHDAVYIIARESQNDTEVVARMLRQGKIMLAEEAKEFGLVHEIVGTLPLQQQDKGIGFGVRHKSPKM